MPTTAREEGRNLIIDLGEAGTFTIPPMRGSAGKNALDSLLSITFGQTRKDEGAEQEIKQTRDLTLSCLGCTSRLSFRRRRQFVRMRASHQELVGMAAILWNVHGGSIDAVNDLLDEQGGGYPKALGRVMESCGLGKAYEALTTLLNGVSQAQNSATDSLTGTSTPTGTRSISST